MMLVQQAEFVTQFLEQYFMSFGSTTIQIYLGSAILLPTGWCGTLPLFRISLGYCMFKLTYVVFKQLHVLL